MTQKRSIKWNEHTCTHTPNKSDKKLFSAPYCTTQYNFCCDLWAQLQRKAKHWALSCAQPMVSCSNNTHTLAISEWHFQRFVYAYIHVYKRKQRTYKYRDLYSSAFLAMTLNKIRLQRLVVWRSSGSYQQMSQCGERNVDKCMSTQVRTSLSL